MIKTSTLYMTETKEEELCRLMEIESHPENRPELFVSSREEHQFHLENENYILFSIYSKQEEMVGYAMVQLDFHSKTFLLRRIAFMEKGKGYGRSALGALIKYCFEELDFNRFYLDVYPHNKRAIHLYEDLGLIWEGTLRQNYFYQGVFLDQRLYSMLKSEYVDSPLQKKAYRDL